MALQHFSNTQSHTTLSEPICSNLCEIIFGDGFEYESELCYKIKNDILYFYLNYDSSTGKVHVMDFIQSKDKIDIVEIKYHDMEGEVIFIVIIENFYFKEIINLFDFDWNKTSDIKKVKVRFGYDNARFYDNRSYKQYIRKLKLDNIDSSSKEYNFIIT